MVQKKAQHIPIVNGFTVVICVNVFLVHGLGNRRIMTSHTVDGCEILHQLVDGKHSILTPSVCSVLYLPLQGGAPPVISWFINHGKYIYIP